MIDPSTAASLSATSPTQKDAVAAWMEDIAPFGILTTDTQFRVTSWNQWLSTHSSLSSADVTGKFLFDLFPSLQERKLEQYYRQALAGSVSVLSAALHEYVLPLPSTVREHQGSNMLQTARVAPLHSGTRVLGTITVIEDVTQREYQAETLRRQHSREKLLSWTLAQLLRASDPLKEATQLFPKIASELGLRGYIKLANGKALVGQADANSPVSTVLGAGAAEAEKAGVLCDYCAKERLPVSINRIRDGGAKFAALTAYGVQAYAGFPLVLRDRLHGVLCFASFDRDTISSSDVEYLSMLSQYVLIALDRSERETSLRNAQQGLRQHAEELENKISERTVRLHETISQLESFSYSIAHDLRAPIRALKGYCSILIEEYSKKLDADGVDITRKLSRAAQRLDELTRDLLKFSSISLQPVNWEPVSLDQVLHDVSALNPLLQKVRVTIRSPLGGVYGNRTFIHQCLSNLLDNSLKFADPKRALQVTIWSELEKHVAPGPKPTSRAPFSPAVGRAEGDQTTELQLCRRLWIEDNGIGIPPEAHQKIFGIFERATDSNTEGTGIGLAIVARAMQQMGGSCGVNSTPGNGSAFWLQFYPHPEHPHPNSPARVESTASS